MLQSLFIKETSVVLFVLILIRVSSFLLSSSIFSAVQIPVPVKILFSLSMSLIIYELNRNVILPVDGLIIFYAAKEVLIGLCLGMVTRFFFHAIAMGSEIISMSIGLSAASTFNPINGVNSNLIEQFQGLLAILVFLSIQGHHLLVGAITQSFDFVPLTATSVKIAGVSEFVLWTKNLFEIAIKIAAPIVSSIFLVNLSMGILGRAVPQINVFVTSFQVTILIGFLVLFISMPLFLNGMVSIVDLTQSELYKLMRSF
ncbi:MAG: flagellar biosynthetic protein FliR [Bdellovibrionales bacterium]|nr:flagellar biosynthetic protein FliR [Bdellovibrionales bacterium]